jgi:hypothetical protein
VHTGFWRGQSKKTDQLENLRIGKSVMLKWVFKKWDKKVWTGLIWLRMGKNGKRL